MGFIRAALSAGLNSFNDSNIEITSDPFILVTQKL